MSYDYLHSQERLVKILKRLTEVKHNNIVNFIDFWHDRVNNQDRVSLCICFLVWSTRVSLLMNTHIHTPTHTPTHTQTHTLTHTARVYHRVHDLWFSHAILNESQRSGQEENSQ